MLPLIATDSTLTENYLRYFQALRQTHFTGEICTDYAARLAVATDNSIYQVIPAGVVFPRSTQDISILFQLAAQKNHHTIQFCPRGGGTSTNGQSITGGIIIDCSRYLRDILELNLKEQWVRVQPGVVLDQLNDFLKPYGVSFAPEISPSNRATIGGMVNTDACGVGSRILGRTSDHVLDLTCVLNNGRVIQSKQCNELNQALSALFAPYQNAIAEKFTSAPRTLSGYNLKKTYQDQHINLNYLFCGSEGTLAVISECKLKLTPIPQFKTVLVVKYRNFDDALRAIAPTDAIQPFAIEAIDEKLIELARQDASYFQIKEFIDGENNNTRAINIVEFVANDLQHLTQVVEQFCAVIEQNKNNLNHALGYYIAKNPAEIKLIWELRKKSVGLISKECDGSRRPIPFVEDTAVPPEKLADYIQEFKTVLDKHQLHYGMYGHVDAGCVHVRPALDMKLLQDETLVREITENVVTLLKKYHGVLWGEHGHGYRSEYGETFFGKELFHLVRQIKTLFDPRNQLNPGKIATALHSQQTMAKLDGPLRGTQDRQIPAVWQSEFTSALACNGNGACFNVATTDTMCPSYKVTQNRIHSPKGRAAVMREWLRQLANKKITLDVMRKGNFFKKIMASFSKKPDFSREVYASMSACLACKACKEQCPLSVDIPDLKAKFLALYHQRYWRSFSDYMIAGLERWVLLQAKLPRLTNSILQLKWMRYLIRKILGLVDVPTVSSLSLKAELTKRGAPAFDLAAADKTRSVILLQDIFTSFYEPQILLAVYDVLTQRGFSVYVAPFFMNGKPLHVKGFLRKFTQRVKANHTYLRQLATFDIPIVGIDPSITLTYRDEYATILGQENINVLLLQEWWTQHLPSSASNNLTETYYLLSHCTEKTACAMTEKQWQQIFAAYGLRLIPLAVGCCGMAGAYGHEVQHQANSKKLFDMDWRRYLAENQSNVVATGYSCRTQTHRMLVRKLQHPAEVLLNRNIK